MRGLVPPVSAPSQSSSSIAPVGLEEPVETLSTLQLRLPLRRRALRRVVIAAVSACALILVAAGVTRVVHASSEPDRAARAVAAPSPSIANRPAPPAEATGTSEGANTSAGAASGGLTAQSPPMAGTLHLERSVTPHFVLLDGRKLTSRTEVVACGPHTIKVGHGKARPIDIPCGGDLTVGR